MKVFIWISFILFVLVVMPSIALSLEHYGNFKLMFLYGGISLPTAYKLFEYALEQK